MSAVTPSARVPGADGPDADLLAEVAADIVGKVWPLAGQPETSKWAASVALAAAGRVLAERLRADAADIDQARQRHAAFSAEATAYRAAHRALIDAADTVALMCGLDISPGAPSPEGAPHPFADERRGTA